jgi:hypothetical protein
LRKDFATKPLGLVPADFASVISLRDLELAAMMLITY